MRPTIALVSLSAALAGALAWSPAAQARTVYATVVDVDALRGSGRQVCEPVRHYDSRHYDDGYDRNGYDDGRRDANRVAGTVAGAVVGGVIGNQVGDGNGRTAATVAGAVIGGLAGREIQERTQDRNRHDNRHDDSRYDSRNRSQRCWTEYRGRRVGYEVTYRLDNGYVFTDRSAYAPRIGSRVRVAHPGWPR